MNMKRKNSARLFRRVLSGFVLILMVFTLSGCKRKGADWQEFSQLGTIAELATYKNFYHNVAEYESGEKSFLRLNYKKIWIEYSGIVQVGIDAAKVSIKKTDSSDVVVVTIPPARVLNIDFDEDSIQKRSEKGSIFSSLSSQIDLEIFAKAQEDMEQKARQDENMLIQAQNRAKKVIGQYIQKCGEAVGRNYTIEWEEIEDDNPVIPA